MPDTPTAAETDAEAVWRELSERLRRFIRRRVASEADVDDILQETFLRIHQKRDALRRADRLEAWVFQVARNAVADHYRRRGRAGGAEGPPQAREAPEAEAAAEEDASNRNAEIAGCLRALIDRLPPDQRRAVTLYELEGESQKRIAERERISLSGVKSRIQRGRRRLEAMLLDCCRFELDRRGNVLDYAPAGALAESPCEGGCNCA